MSFLFPGLGQAYAGAYVRAAALAIPPVIALAIVVVLVLSQGAIDFGLWIGQSSVLGPLAILNVVLLAYRAVAAIDAYRLAVEPAGPSATGLHRVGRKPGQLDPISIAGLAGILVVLVAGHVIVGYWDLKFYNLTKDIHTALVLDTSTPNASDTPEPTVSYPPQMTFEPAPTIKPWDKTERLNILLVGVDQAAGLTDTMIVASIDPVTHQVAMFSILRDTIGLPLPPRSQLSKFWGTNFVHKLNEMYKDADKFKYPGGGSAALKQALGYTFFGNQNAIQYYALVNFDGFRKVVDTLGGVTLNVPYPIVNDGYRSFGDLHRRVYIPAGLQHLTGDEALSYARIRHGGYSVFDRTMRQQQLLVSLEQHANINEISSHLSELVDALGRTIHTDIPEGPDVLGPMIQLAKSVKSSDIKTYVFSDTTPDVAAIRAVVKAAFAPGSKSPDQLQAAIDESAPIVVENGTGTSGQDTSLATYLQALGLNAQASADQPSQLGGTTRLLCINSAATQYPATLALLESKLGLVGSPSPDTTATIQVVADPNQAVGFVIVTGTNLPTLSAPPN